MKHCYYFVLLSLFALLSCEQWDLDTEEFLKVQLTGLEPLSLDSVRLSAVIEDLVEAQVESHGFVWSTDGTTPTVLANGGQINLGLKDANPFPALWAPCRSIRPTYLSPMLK